jgi:hypothetical protein
MSGQIFISYRRDGVSHLARRLYDRLSSRFPKNQIFMDVDAIDPGEDFVKAIEKTVAESDVLIAVIGPHWLTSAQGKVVWRQKVDPAPPTASSGCPTGTCWSACSNARHTLVELDAAGKTVWQIESLGDLTDAHRLDKRPGSAAEASRA